MVGRDGQSWHVEKAERFMAAANRAFESEDWETAVSRAYYAVYHIVIAVLATRAGVERPRWDHIQLQRDFRAHFARRGFLFSIRDAEEFADLHKARLIADYERPQLSRQRARILLTSARRLYGRILEVLRNV